MFEGLAQALNKQKQDRRGRSMRNPYEHIQWSVSGRRSLSETFDKNGFLKTHIIINILQWEFGIKTSLIKDFTSLRSASPFLSNGKGLPANKEKFFHEIVALFLEASKILKKNESWNISYAVLFEKKYEDDNELKVSLLGVAYALNIRLPPHDIESLPHHKLISVSEELGRFERQLADPNSPVLLIKGENGAGKSILLDKAYQMVTEKHPECSVVKIDLFEYRTLDEMFEMLRDELLDCLSKELSSNIKPHGDNILPSDSIMQVLRKLIRMRKRWIFFVDSTSNYLTSTDQAFYNLLKGSSVTDFVTNILSLNQLIGSDIRVVITTQDISLNLAGASEIVCKGKAVLANLDNSIFGNYASLLEYYELGPRSIFRLSVLERLIQQKWFSTFPYDVLGENINFILANIDKKKFDLWLIKEIRISAGPMGSACLLISALPDDDIRETSLQKILVEYLEKLHRSSVINKLRSKVSHLIGRNLEEIVDNTLEMLDGFIVKRYDTLIQGESIKYVKVQPYIRKLILDHTNERSLGLAYEFAGKFAIKKYQDKVSRISKSNALSNVYGKFAQAIRFQIRGAKYHISREGGELKNTGVVAICESLIFFIELLKKIDSFQSIELRFNLIMEFLLIEKNTFDIPRYRNTPPIMSTNLINMLGPDASLIMKELLVSSQQLNKHNIALAIIELLKSGLFPSAELSKSGVDNLKTKMEEALFFTANRTGKYGQALWHVNSLLKDRETQLVKVLRELPGRFPVVKARTLHEKLIDSQTKRLMVSFSIGNEEEIFKSLVMLLKELFDTFRFRAFKRSEYFESVKKANYILSNAMILDLYKQHLTSLLTVFHSEEEIAALVDFEMQNIFEVNGELTCNNFGKETFVKWGRHLPKPSIFAIVELKRTISRYKSLIQAGKVKNEKFILEFEYLCSDYQERIDSIYRPLANKLLLAEDSSQLQHFYVFLGYSTDSCDEIYDSWMEQKTEFDDLSNQPETPNDVKDDAVLNYHDIMTKELTKKYNFCRKQFLSIDWYRLLSVPWQSDVLIELLRLEIVVLFVKSECCVAIDLDEYAWIEGSLNRLIIESEKYDDFRTLSNALTLTATFKRLVINEIAKCSITLANQKEKHIEQLEAEFDVAWRKLYAITLHSDYRYRMPEIREFEEGRNPLYKFLI